MEYSCVELPPSKTLQCIHYEDIVKTEIYSEKLVPVEVADLNAHIVGLNVSSDQEFLLVNCRPSASGSLIEQLKLKDKPPIMSDKMEVRILKASNLQVVHTVYGHVGFSQIPCCCILLDSSKQFIARQDCHLICKLC